MIKVIAVDDELPVLKMTESVLRTLDDVRICGLFHDPDELLERLEKTEVDLIFVDMKMPGMHGLELAERIHEMNLDVAIVFVTAYSDYAIDAFGVEAFDYIMKPITAERLHKVLDRFVRKKEARRQDAPSKGISVHGFGRFGIKTEQGKKLKFSRAKTEELFAFLLHHRGKTIPKEVILDALWGDRDAERAQALLYTTVYQLRKELEAFGLREVIDYNRAQYRLRWFPDYWDCDEFERGYWRYKNGESDIAAAKQMVELHHDGYLVGNSYEWAVDRRIAFELQCAELLEDIVDFEVQQQRFEFALSYLHKWAQLLPFMRRVHIKIIAVHLLMNNREVAVAHERQIRDLFAAELDVSLHIDIPFLAVNPWSVF